MPFDSQKSPGLGGPFTFQLPQVEGWMQNVGASVSPLKSYFS